VSLSKIKFVTLSSFQLRYKRRLYKGMSVEEKQLKSLHTKSNLKRFLDYVSSGHCEKVTKMCGKGLDPNFHCPETGGKARRRLRKYKIP
jgi:hypothetical protein